MRPSQNLPLPPRIYPPPLSTTILSTPSRNLPPPPPPFQQIYMCDPPRIYPSLSEYTPLSTTICDPLRIYPSLPEYTPFSTTILLCDASIIYPPPPRIYPSFNNCMRHPQKLPFPQRITPLFWQLYAPSLSEYILRPLSTIFQESTPQSVNIPPCLETTGTCNCERI